MKEPEQPAAAKDRGERVEEDEEQAARGWDEAEREREEDTARRCAQKQVVAEQEHPVRRHLPTSHCYCCLPRPQADLFLITPKQTEARNCERKEDGGDLRVLDEAGSEQA